MSAATATTAPTTTAMGKKSVKVRWGHVTPDFSKLRENLRERCKERIKERREELFNQRRFGVSSDTDVEVKLKEIFEEELVDLVTDEVSEARNELEKHIDSKQLLNELRTELEKSIANDESKSK